MKLQGILFVAGMVSVTSVCASAATPIIAPISTTPGGPTYGRWAAEWWQWALGIPAATNPARAAPRTLPTISRYPVMASTGIERKDGENTPPLMLSVKRHRAVSV
jgi:hypothetical protein